jgi:hypothetical protein
LDPIIKGWFSTQVNRYQKNTSKSKTNNGRKSYQRNTSKSKWSKGWTQQAKDRGK